MSELTVRDRIIRALENLPQDATFEDTIEGLVFLAKIEAGLAELNTGTSRTTTATAARIEREMVHRSSVAREVPQG